MVLSGHIGVSENGYDLEGAHIESYTLLKFILVSTYLWKLPSVKHASPKPYLSVHNPDALTSEAETAIMRALHDAAIYTNPSGMCPHMSHSLNSLMVVPYIILYITLL